MKRSCSRVACAGNAIATLTYAYDDSVVVIGPLSFDVDPHAYDLCSEHVDNFSVPKSWQIIRHRVFQ